MAEVDLTGFGLPLPPPRGRSASRDTLAEIIRRVRALKASQGLSVTVQPQRQVPVTQRGVIQEPARRPQVPTPQQQYVQPIQPQRSITYRRVIDTNPTKPLIRRLLSAFARQKPYPQVVQIDYLTIDGKRITRQVEPYEIVSKRRANRLGATTYLYARCATHGTTHSFILNRIQSIQGTGRTYVPEYEVRM
jgi:hypothetical protein